MKFDLWPPRQEMAQMIRNICCIFPIKSDLKLKEINAIKQHIVSTKGLKTHYVQLFQKITLFCKKIKIKNPNSPHHFGRFSKFDDNLIYFVIKFFFFCFFLVIWFIFLIILFVLWLKSSFLYIFLKVICDYFLDFVHFFSLLP